MSRTPILDGEQPLPARKLRWGLALLVGVALGGVFIAIERASGARQPVITPRGILFFVVAFYIAVFVHEAGHLMAGWIAGFEPRTFMVGMFFLHKEARGWRFQFRPRYLMAGGLAAAIPLSDQNLLRRYLLLVAGGPAASLALVPITIFAAGTAGRILFWVNLILLISACIPYTASCYPSDAKLMALLPRGGPLSGRLVAVVFLLSLDAQGKEPDQWPRKYLAALDVVTKDNSRMPPALSFLLADAAGREDLARTAELLERALAICHKMPPMAQQGFLTAASCYHGFAHGDVTRAEKWLDQARKVKGSAARKDWDSKALAAVLYAKGEFATAGEMLARYIAFLDRQPMSGMLAAERRRILDLQEEMASAIERT
jgi:hypothetical protein